MTLKVNVPADVEHTLEEAAVRTGQNLADFAAAILVRAARASQEANSAEAIGGIAARLTALERIGIYDTRARAGLPPLSDEAINRECVYYRSIP